MKIEVGDRVYEVKKPIGRLGAIHFALLTKVAGDVVVDENGNLAPTSMAKLSEIFLEWRDKVLKHIIKEDIEKMEGQDQFAIFLALVSSTNVSEELFRVVEP